MLLLNIPQHLIKLRQIKQIPMQIHQCRNALLFQYPIITKALFIKEMRIKFKHDFAQYLTFLAILL